MPSSTVENRLVSASFVLLLGSLSGGRGTKCQNFNESPP